MIDDRVTQEAAEQDLYAMLDKAKGLYPQHIRKMCCSLIGGAALQKIDGQDCELCVIGWLVNELCIVEPFDTLRQFQYEMRPIERWVLPVQPASIPEEDRESDPDESARRSMLIAQWTTSWAHKNTVLGLP